VSVNSECQREAKPQVRRGIGRFSAPGAVSTTEILDIFEGTQQIQQLIVARRLLGKTSAELK
jgi:alkylation response protein AidB-like acyl-CoA dehydrogenase